MEISLLRHPETIANQQRVFQGRRDWPLSATGEGQLQALSARLEGRRFDLVVASPLGRAMSTAERFASAGGYMHRVATLHPLLAGSR